MIRARATSPTVLATAWCTTQIHTRGPTAIFQIANWNELVVYEMHIGTFWVPDGSAPGTYTDAIAKLDHLKSLGVNCVDLLPMAEFPGDISWATTPAIHSRLKARMEHPTT